MMRRLIAVRADFLVRLAADIEFQPAELCRDSHAQTSGLSADPLATLNTI